VDRIKTDLTKKSEENRIEDNKDRDTCIGVVGEGFGGLSPPI